jgi:hypothetical protein
MSAPCPFEKPILSAQCGCELSTRELYAERMNAGCRSDVAAHNCRVLLALLMERSRFALRLADRGAPLPFGKQMKVMVGGLLGLQRVLHAGQSDADEVVANVHGLVVEAHARYGGLESLPYQEIVRSVAAYQGRRHRHSPRE